jgi:hypothetical protein
MKISFTRAFSFFTFLSIGLLAAGCSGEGGGKVVPVEGMVMVGNEPLKEGSIAFHPDESKGNKSGNPSVGTITDGKFNLTTGGQVGAPVGYYKVTVNSSAPSDPKDEYSVPKSLINSKYENPETSGLTAEVKEGAGSYEFKVTK